MSNVRPLLAAGLLMILSACASAPEDSASGDSAVQGGSATPMDVGNVVVEEVPSDEPGSDLAHIVSECAAMEQRINAALDTKLDLSHTLRRFQCPSLHAFRVGPGKDHPTGVVRQSDVDAKVMAAISERLGGALPEKLFPVRDADSACELSADSAVGLFASVSQQDSENRRWIDVAGAVRAYFTTSKALTNLLQDDYDGKDLVDVVDALAFDMTSWMDMPHVKSKALGGGIEPMKNPEQVRMCNGSVPWPRLNPGACLPRVITWVSTITDIPSSNGRDRIANVLVLSVPYPDPRCPVPALSTP